MTENQKKGTEQYTLYTRGRQRFLLGGPKNGKIRNLFLLRAINSCFFANFPHIFLDDLFFLLSIHFKQVDEFTVYGLHNSIFIRINLYLGFSNFIMPFNKPIKRDPDEVVEQRKSRFHKSLSSISFIDPLKTRDIN